jgi:hypothetical protein
MMIGAKIMLRTEMDATRDELADLAGASWMMSLPRCRRANGRGGMPRRAGGCHPCFRA